MKFAAYYHLSIYAISDSPEAAVAKARRDSKEPEVQFQTARISDELAAWIDENGWNCNRRSFEVRDGFIIDTTL